jgi:DNA repair protein RecO (recombination protein O)
MQRIELQPALVLHARAYRDTSFLVNCLTPDYGRIAVVARGVRRAKNSQRSLINPFNPLLISVQGKNSLKLMTAFEASAHPIALTGERLFSGLYVNELLLRLLPEWDSCSSLYYAYQETLHALLSHDIEDTLRRFEKMLLQQLGYGIDWHREAQSGELLVPEARYKLEPEQGFVLVSDSYRGCSYQGASLQQLAQDHYTTRELKRDAKRISRTLLRPLLGDKPLKSRELFV